jgi:hypothetical protein
MQTTPVSLKQKLATAFRAVRSAAYRVGVVDNPAIVKAHEDIIGIITSRGTIRLEQDMMIRIPHWTRASEERPIQFLVAMALELRDRFGTNKQFVNELLYLLNKKPELVTPVLFRLARAFTLANQHGYNFRELIPALYWWMTDKSFSNVPGNPDHLPYLLDRVCAMMERGDDPVEKLMYSALVEVYDRSAAFNF